MAESPDGKFLPRLLWLEARRHGLLPNFAAVRFYLPYSIVLISECHSAEGLLEGPNLSYTDFIEPFANAGSKFIIALLWPVKTNASQTITTKLFEIYEVMIWRLQFQWLNLQQKTDNELFHSFSWCHAPSIHGRCTDE